MILKEIINPNQELFEIFTQRGAFADDRMHPLIGDGVQHHVSKLDNKRIYWEELYATPQGKFFEQLRDVFVFEPDENNLQEYLQEYSIPKDQASYYEKVWEDIDPEDALNQTRIPYEEWERHPQQWKDWDFSGVAIKPKWRYVSNYKDRWMDVLPVGHPWESLIKRYLIFIDKQDWLLEGELRNKLLDHLHLQKLLPGLKRIATTEESLEWLIKMTKQIIENPLRASEIVSDELSLLDGQVTLWYSEKIKSGRSEELESLDRIILKAKAIEDIRKIARWLMENKKGDKLTWFKYRRRRERLAKKLKIRECLVNEEVVKELAAKFGLSKVQARMLVKERPYYCRQDFYRKMKEIRKTKEK